MLCTTELGGTGEKCTTLTVNKTKRGAKERDTTSCLNDRY